MDKYGDVSVDLNSSDHVATVEIHRPPHNYFDDALILSLAQAFEAEIIQLTALGEHQGGIEPIALEACAAADAYRALHVAISVARQALRFRKEQVLP